MKMIEMGRILLGSALSFAVWKLSKNSLSVLHCLNTGKTTIGEHTACFANCYPVGVAHFFAKKLDSCVISVDFFIIIVIILYVGIFFDTPINKIRLELL